MGFPSIVGTFKPTKENPKDLATSIYFSAAYTYQPDPRSSSSPLLPLPTSPLSSTTRLPILTSNPVLKKPDIPDL